MELKVLSSKKTELEFVLAGERHTLPNLLNEALQQDSAVVFASYKLHHPLDSDSIFIVHTKGKTPKKALADALKKADVQMNEFQKAVKALK